MAFRTWLSGLFGGNATDVRRGEQYGLPHVYAESPGSIDEDRALQLSAVYRCITVVCNMVGSIPVSHYIEGDKGQQKVKSDLWDLLQNKANPHQTGQEFRETLALNLMLHGNAYARIGRNVIGSPVALWGMPAPSVTPELLSGGELVYNEQRHTGESPIKVVHKADDVLHIKLFGNGFTGLSPIAHAAQSLGIAAAQENFTSQYFTSGGKPGGLLKTDRTFTADQRAQLQQNLAPYLNGGQQSAHKTLLLEAGMDYQQIQLTPQDLATLESRAYQVEDIARWFGVPLPLIGMGKQASERASNVDAIIRGWLMTDLGPLLDRFTQAFANALLTPKQRATNEFKFESHEIIKTDIATLMDVCEKGVRNGVMTQNEARERVNLPRLDGEGHDTLRQQQQMVQSDTSNQGVEDNEQTTDTDQ